MFSERSLRQYLPDGWAALPVTVWEEASSTNTLAREAAEAGAPHGALFAAASQTAGRGRRGRTFYSPSGTGLYFSLILRPQMDASRALRITTAAAVALCRALEHLGAADTGIKWVNDVFCRGRKAAGILTEASFAADGGMRYAVLGVGVNVTPPAGGFPPEISSIAGAALDAPLPDARERVLARFLEEFFLLYDGIGAPRASYMEEYRRRCFLLGKPVTVIPTGGGTPYGAVAEDVDEECGLLVRLPDGRRVTLSTGEVSVREKETRAAP